MRLVTQDGRRFVLGLTREELGGLSNALNEVCNGLAVDDQDLETRVGASREELRRLLAGLVEALRAPPGETETVAAWTDGGSVQVRCLTTHGDPADMSPEEARALARLLDRCADEAEGR